MKYETKELPGNTKESLSLPPQKIDSRRKSFILISRYRSSLFLDAIISKRWINLANIAEMRNFRRSCDASRLQTIFRISMITSDADRSPYFTTPARAYANNETFHNPSYNVLYERTRCESLRIIRVISSSFLQVSPE